MEGERPSEVLLGAQGPSSGAAFPLPERTEAAAQTSTPCREQQSSEVRDTHALSLEVGFLSGCSTCPVGRATSGLKSGFGLLPELQLPTDE